MRGKIALLPTNQSRSAIALRTLGLPHAEWPTTKQILCLICFCTATRRHFYNPASSWRSSLGRWKHRKLMDRKNKPTRSAREARRKENFDSTNRFEIRPKVEMDHETCVFSRVTRQPEKDGSWIFFPATKRCRDFSGRYQQEPAASEDANRDPVR